MAWGYEKCFTIEHDNTLKHKIDCKDCIYYDSSDKSCMKRPLYLPVDGYNSWRRCEYFELDHKVSHYDEKNMQYLRSQRKMVREVPKYSEVNGILIKKSAHKMDKAEIGKRTLDDGYIFNVVKYLPVDKKISKTINVKLSKGGYRKIEIAFDSTSKTIFISNRSYTKETIEDLYHIFNCKKNRDKLLEFQ